jgi:Uma2 family endonuclease
MTYISSKTLTKEDFLSQYQDHPQYELADGELIDIEPTGPHETVSGKVATQIGIHLVAE